MGSTGRGVDNSIDGWVTDYMLFSILLTFAIRLFFVKHRSNWAASTQLFMSGGYLFGALGHHVFPNRAVDSPCGDHGFYAVWIAAYTCQALSCVSWLKWADTFLHWKWTRIPMVVMCTLTILVAGTIDYLSAWCLLEVKHQPAVDRWTKPCEGDAPKCDSIAVYAEGVFYLAWGFSWFLVSVRVCTYLLDNADKFKNSFFGLPVLHFLNFWAPFALFTYGPFLIVYVYGYSVTNGLDVNKLYSDLHVGIVYHTGVISTHVCTYFISQSLELAVAKDSKKGK